MDIRTSATTKFLFVFIPLAVACTDPEPMEDGAPAQELQAFSPDEGELDAPSPVVEEAVREAALEVEDGEATFYADVLEGRQTASGETFSQDAMVAAHRAFPFNTRLRVTNTDNDRSVEVRVVDRGPFGAPGSTPAILDLSKSAARQLGFIDAGRANVRVEVLEWGP